MRVTAVPETGALYRWPARFIHPVAGFLGFWMVLGTHVALAAYAATFGVTLHALLPAIPARPAAVVALAGVLLINLLGTEVSGRANVAIVVLVALSLAALAAAGLPRVDAHRLLPLVPHGWGTLLAVSALLTYPISGATLVSELAGEMRHPARDVPVAILGSTVTAAVLYVAVALVAAGVPGLPAGVGLETVAQHVMGSTGAVLFGLGAGLVSMLGIINTHMLWGSRSVLMVCHDNWLPRPLATPNRRGAPTVPLLLLAGIGFVPLLAGLDVGAIIQVGGLGACASAILSVACAPIFARRDPARYDRSPLAIRRPLLLAASVAAIGSQLATAVLLLGSLAWTPLLGWLAWLAAGLLLAVVRRGGVSDPSAAPADRAPARAR